MMLFSSQEPLEEEGQVNWDHEKLDQVKSFHAWKAAQMVGVHCHWLYRSIPCYEILTKGALKCPYHDKAALLHWNGYLPLYRDNNRPTIVIIKKINRDTVARIPIHAPVLVSRAEKRGSSIHVGEKSWAKMWLKPKDWQAPPDITRALLTWWKEPALTEYLLAQAGKDVAPASDKPLSPVPASKEERQQRSEEWVKGVRDAALRQAGYGPAGDNLPPQLGDVLPIANGVHRKKS
jgi:hypothetical protein